MTEDTEKPILINTIFTIVMAGIIVFFPMLLNDFVWDDVVQIVQNGDIYSIKNIPGLFSTGNLGIFYRPVFYSTLAVLYSLSKLETFLYHFFQLSIHISNAVLVFLLFKRFIEKRLAFLLSLLFLIHPINAEAVVFISAVSDTLFVFLGLLALQLLMKKQDSLRTGITASIFLLLSLLTKEGGFLFIAIIFLYRLILRRQIFPSTLAILALPVGVYSVLRFYVANIFFAGVKIVPIAEASLAERILTIPKIVFYYISTFLFPVRLAISQHWVVRSATFGDFYLPLIFDLGVIVALTWMGIFIYKQQKQLFPAYIFFLSWFLIGLLPYLQLVPLDMTVAERWFYFPIIGLLGACGLLVDQIFGASKPGNKTALVLIPILVMFSLRTIVRTLNWSSGYALYSHDEKVETDNYLLKNNLAVELIKRDEHDTALTYSEEAIRLNSDWGKSWSTAGTIYLIKKDFPKANHYFRESLKRDWGNFGAYYYLGQSLLTTREYLSAKEWIEQGLKSFPDNGELTGMLAMAEYGLGNQPRALDLAKKAVSWSPGPQTQLIYDTILNQKQFSLEQP